MLRQSTSKRDVLIQVFRERFGRSPEGAAEAPGRVNLIGEHVDYNDGLVLPLAIDRSVRVVFARRDDAMVRAWSANFNEESTFSLEEYLGHDNEHAWSNYLRGVANALQAVEGPRCGVDMAIAGDVPPGTGLSSSAALTVAAAGALNAAWRLSLDDKQIALIACRAENDFVGVKCGVMDQLASALGRACRAVLIDCRSLECSMIPLPFEELGVEIVIVDSGVPRRLSTSPYNERRQECEQACEQMKRLMLNRAPASLRDVSLQDVEAHKRAMSPTLFRRARHVVSEIERVREGVAALRRRNVVRFGELMCASHESLRDDYEVSCPELDLLVELALGAGAVGARLTGAGFGGCTVNLVRKFDVGMVGRSVTEQYRNETGRVARVLVCKASDGLRITAA